MSVAKRSAFDCAFPDASSLSSCLWSALACLCQPVKTGEQARCSFSFREPSVSLSPLDLDPGSRSMPTTTPTDLNAMCTPLPATAGTTIEGIVRLRGLPLGRSTTSSSRRSPTGTGTRAIITIGQPSITTSVATSLISLLRSSLRAAEATVTFISTLAAGDLSPVDLLLGHRAFLEGNSVSDA